MEPLTIEIFDVPSRVGAIRAALGPRGLVAVRLSPASDDKFNKRIARLFPGALTVRVEADSRPAGRLLIDYMAGRERAMKTDLDLRGLTPFSLAVMKAARRIPYGRTTSYGQLAAKAGSPRAARAVGGVMAANPLPLFIPCHRVVGSDGSLTGFGSGLPVKEALLAMEQGGPDLAAR